MRVSDYDRRVREICAVILDDEAAGAARLCDDARSGGVCAAKARRSGR
jgi:hypothetical protein